MAANAAMAVVLVAAFGTWINVRDIGEDFHCVVGEWNTRASYADQGTTLCFLKRVQDLSPKAPAGYSAEEAERLLAEAGTAAGAGGNGSHEGRVGEGGAPGTGRDGSQEGADKVLPTVIAIMNETFSDLSRFESLAGTAARPTHYYELAQESLAWGTAYASAFGAGTCNSEFEFLTGSSMGNFGDGVYPYVLYDLGGNENLVTYFKSLGYATRAIHPADAANWRRDRVYGQLGFDAFDDISAFEGAETLRGFTTDRETYDYVLDLVEEGTGPQFVFDVTIQNHGGYDTGLVPSDLQVTAPVDGVSFAEVDEYASCLAQSDEDLAYLVERLRALDEPVVVCFFGDHQPAFDDALAEAVYGDAAGAAALEDVQERYAVPYLVWANYDVEDNAAEGTQDEEAAARQGTQATDTSLNYLGAELVRAGRIADDRLPGVPRKPARSRSRAQPQRIHGCGRRLARVRPKAVVGRRTGNAERTGPAERLRHRPVREPVRIGSFVPALRGLPALASRGREFDSPQDPRTLRSLRTGACQAGWFARDGGRAAGSPAPTAYRFSRTQAMLPCTVATSSSTSSNLRMGRSQCMNSTTMGLPYRSPSKSSRWTSHVAFARSANVAGTPTLTAAR